MKVCSMGEGKRRPNQKTRQSIPVGAQGSYQNGNDHVDGPLICNRRFTGPPFSLRNGPRQGFRRAPTLGSSTPMALWPWHGCISRKAAGRRTVYSRSVCRIVDNSQIYVKAGAGYGLFSLRYIESSTPLFTIPASALPNHLTLAPHYPPTKPELTCTQFISLHLLLHRPLNGCESSDPLFGPYISVLPQNFDFHPVTWLWKRRNDIHRSTLESQLVNSLPPSVLEKLEKILALFNKDWRRIQNYLVGFFKRPVMLYTSTYL